jgi:hypothetical protein
MGKNFPLNYYLSLFLFQSGPLGRDSAVSLTFTVYDAPHPPVSQSRPWQHVTFALHHTTTSICMETEREQGEGLVLVPGLLSCTHPLLGTRCNILQSVISSTFRSPFASPRYYIMSTGANKGDVFSSSFGLVSSHGDGALLMNTFSSSPAFCCSSLHCITYRAM